MKKHVVVFFCYKLFDIHKKSFDNISELDADFFIVENFSEKSEQIKEIFLNHKNYDKIVRYIRFNCNTSNFGTFVIRHFHDFLKEYEYITFTDGDFVFENIHAMKNEVFNNLNYNDIAISGVDLLLDNLPNIPNSEHWVPKGYIDTNRGYIECQTGIHFMTLKNNSLTLLQNITFLDDIIYRHIRLHNKKWVKTLINKAYHLTWDLYYEGNPYYEFKKDFVWNFNSEYDEFTTIK